MEPSTNGSSHAATNGIPSHDPSTYTNDLSRVLEALEAVYSPRSTNQTRQAATSYLDEAKRLPQAPSHGVALALDKTQHTELRHFGLSMLEYCIKYAWDGYSAQQAEALRAYVVQLAESVEECDPPYLRNKVGQLWSEVAKRSWAAEWMDMDELLVRLWESDTNSSQTKRVLVLYVLETLSDEVFGGEDPIAGMRGQELNQALFEILAPEDALSEQIRSRERADNVRFGAPGWLYRMCDYLGRCLQTDGKSSQDEGMYAAALKALSTLRAVLIWMPPKAIAKSQCREAVMSALDRPQWLLEMSRGTLKLQTAAIEALFAFYSRSGFQDEDFHLVAPLLAPREISLLRNVYKWAAQVNPDNMDEDRYLLCKKCTEVDGSPYTIAALLLIVYSYFLTSVTMLRRDIT